MCADTDILNTFGYDLFTKLLLKLRLSGTLLQEKDLHQQNRVYYIC
jgi:hypothetical protein